LTVTLMRSIFVSSNKHKRTFLPTNFPPLKIKQNFPQTLS